MKLVLFSHNITDNHKKKLRAMISKPLSDVELSLISTPINDKDFKPDWYIETFNRVNEIFPKTEEFDFQEAIENKPDFDFKAYFKSKDMIHMSGGNTFILSYWMARTESTDIIKELVETEKMIYSGESAGAIYAYKEIASYAPLDEPKRAPEIVNKGLGLIDFAPIPHWNVMQYRQGLERIKNKFDESGIETVPFGDDEAIFVVGEKRSIL